MDWEALFVIGILTAIAGIILYVPMIAWARRKLSRDQKVSGNMKVTKGGFIVLGLMTTILLIGNSQQYWAPDTLIGDLVRTRPGRIIFAAFILLIFWGIERILRTKGILLLERKENRVNGQEHE